MVIFQSIAMLDYQRVTPQSSPRDLPIMIFAHHQIAGQLFQQMRLAAHEPRMGSEVQQWVEGRSRFGWHLAQACQFPGRFRRKLS